MSYDSCPTVSLWPGSQRSYGAPTRHGQHSSAELVGKQGDHRAAALTGRDKRIFRGGNAAVAVGRRGSLLHGATSDLGNAAQGRGGYADLPVSSFQRGLEAQVGGSRAGGSPIYYCQSHQIAVGSLGHKKAGEVDQYVQAVAFRRA